MELGVGHIVITDAALAKGGTFETLVGSDWDATPTRLPRPLLGVELAVRVTVTGRKVRYNVPRLSQEGVVRVDVTFVKDGEPDETVKGWARAKGWGEDFELVKAA